MFAPISFYMVHLVFRYHQQLNGSTLLHIHFRFVFSRLFIHFSLCFLPDAFLRTILVYTFEIVVVPFWLQFCIQIGGWEHEDEDEQAKKALMHIQMLFRSHVLSMCTIYSDAIIMYRKGVRMSIGGFFFSRFQSIWDFAKYIVYEWMKINTKLTIESWCCTNCLAFLHAHNIYIYTNTSWGEEKLRIMISDGITIYWKRVV